MIKHEADRCVLCGLCLPHCPTYGQSRDENESPRGRIALMRAVANGELAMSATVQRHLDNCLLCRACEAKCPSRVNYARMVDASRATFAPPELTPEARLVDELASDKALRRQRQKQWWLAEKSGLRFLGRQLGITRLLGLERLERLAPPMARPGRWPDYAPPTTAKKRGDVALFSGCFGEMFDQQTLRSALTLLNRLGFGVHMPASQGCCGALHHHQGDADTAQQLAQANIEAFNALDVEAIITTASGCGSHLAEYGQFGDEGAGVGRKVCDISEFLSTIEWPKEAGLTPLHKRVAVHEPCSLRNVQKASSFPYKLLEKIPGLELIPLPGNEQCCGGAGSYMLEHADRAARLRQPKLEALARIGADILVTSNIGCSLHIGAGMRAEGRHLELIHPVTLLARQLG